MAGKRKRDGKDGQNTGKSGPKKAKKEIMPIELSTNSKPTLEKKPFIERPIGEDRKREGELYDLLGSFDEEERNDAAECIVSSLLDGDGVPEVVLQRHLGHRLIRGLASSRNASRIGFSIVLTELLAQLFGRRALANTKYTGLTFDSMLELLVDKTQPVGNVSGGEERDHFFGRLFGLECFVKSKILFQDASRWSKVLDMLLKLGNKKIWLRPECGWILVQALEQMSEADTEATLSKVAEAGMAKTPEGVAAWIVTLNRYPILKIQPWKNPLSNKSLAELTAVLKESFKDSANDPKEKQNGIKQASWSAQLHFVWDIILARFLDGNSDWKEEDFDQFWSRVVDDGLFSRLATDGQKFKGFMVFDKMLKGFAKTPAKLQMLFSRNFMSCLLNQSSKEDRYLHRAATKSLKAIEDVIAAHPASLAPVLASLLGRNGSYDFDRRSSTRTVDKLLRNINEQNAEAVLAVIKQPIRSLKKQETAAARSTVRTYADYLAKILNVSASAPSRHEQPGTGHGSFDKPLQELTCLAYCRSPDITQDALTDQIREMCRSRLETSLAKLARCSTDFSVFCQAVASIDSKAMAMTAEIKEARDDALRRMSKLLKSKSKIGSEKDAARGLAMLHAISIFQLYNEDPDAMEVLDDLSQSYDRLMLGNAGKKGETNKGGSEILVEILLSMVARPSSLMREVSQQVFGVFTRQISAEGLELLTGPLASGESTKGQEELFNTEDDAMDVDSGFNGEDDDKPEDVEEAGDIEDVEDASDFEIDSDVEFVGLNGDDDGGSDNDGNDSDEDESQEEGEDDETKDGRKFNQKGEWENPEELDDMLGKILNSHRLDKDIEAESSVDEGDMSDSEMFALEAQLSAAIAPRIKANKPDSKKQKKDAKQSVVNFKYRILDLLDVYVKNEPLNALTLSLLMPLLNLMRTTSTKPLASRACEIILNYRKALKKARSNKDKDNEDSFETDNLLSLLVESLEEAGKDDSQAYAKASSTASLIVASTMLRNDRKSIQQIGALFGKTWSDWTAGTVNMHKSFFNSWQDWSLNIRNVGKIPGTVEEW
ncbi:DNA-directed DNA polymerase [Conoideocrella luteorostrata]|uniref:DNA-directed DNA polymerase n=1 Tax=Conoideocrella luteorostrata TaxID=1105319 RepID=A0AAJ0CQJ1_9HYPO|nr:DNA-directed DNA polymerase [Conoideocrella luteorostrata]